MAKRTIRRRMRKSRTIRKVMRGCNGRRGRGRGRGKRGGDAPPGAKEALQYPGSGANAPLAVLQAEAWQADADAKAQTPPSVPSPIESNMVDGETTTTSAKVEPFGVGSNISSKPAQVGGGYRRGRARTRHHKRKLKYKKSVARKSRRS